MDFARGILRDPLIHFLIAGGILFALYGLIGPGDRRTQDETTIVVDEATLVNFMQYRSQAFEPGYFAAAYKAMSPDERQQLVDSYVREEAMAREARAMGLDEADFVIRQRLIQKILFLVDGLAVDIEPPGDRELEDYFAANAEQYRKPAEASFTHVFVDDEIAHPGGGEQEARRILARLNARQAGFNDAPQFGDRFPYLQNYVGRSEQFIANQFGSAFAEELMKLSPSARWQGPIRSQFGWHVVLLTERSAAGSPKFDEVRQQVLSDYMAEKTGEARDASIADLVEHYDVRIELPDGALPESGGD